MTLEERYCKSCDGFIGELEQNDEQYYCLVCMAQGFDE